MSDEPVIGGRAASEGPGRASLGIITGSNPVGRDTPDFSGPDADQTPQPTPNPEKDPDEWVTGDEPATGPQLSYLETLAREARVDVPEGLTKADASKLIDELQARTGRGQSAGGG